MRIAAKRLRYTMEIFQDVYTLYTGVGPEFGKALKAVKALQEHLGVLHDADVLVPQLLEHMARVLHTGYGPQTPAPSSAQNASPAFKKGKPTPKGIPGAKTAKEIESLPIAGVHRVDYLACQGLLNLCTKTRSDRDARYARLVQDWQQLKSEFLFDRLRQLIASSKEEEETDTERPLVVSTSMVSETGSVIASVPEVLPSDSPALPLAPSDRPEDTENVEDVSPRKNSQVQRAPGEPGHVAAARRRVPARPNTSPPDAARKGKEGHGAEEGRGKREEGRDTTQPPKPDRLRPKSKSHLSHLFRRTQRFCAHCATFRAWDRYGYGRWRRRGLAACTSCALPRWNSCLRFPA